MNQGIGLLSNRVKKNPSADVPESRYTFLRLSDSEPDLGLPLQDNNLLYSNALGKRQWTTNISFNQTDNSLSFHNSFCVKGSTEVVTSPVETMIANFSSSEYGSAKLVIQATNTVTNARQVTELLIVHDGSIASATEYGVVYTGAEPLATFDVDIDSSDVVILATTVDPTSSISYKVSETLLKI